MPQILTSCIDYQALLSFSTRWNCRHTTPNFFFSRDCTWFFKLYSRGGGRKITLRILLREYSQFVTMEVGWI